MNAKLCDFCMIDKTLTLATRVLRITGMSPLHACNTHRTWKGKREDVAEQGLKAIGAYEMLLAKAQKKNEHAR